MGEEGHMDLPTTMPAKVAAATERERAESSATTNVDKVSIDEPSFSPRDFKSPFSRQHTTLEVDDYFVRTLQPQADEIGKAHDWHLDWSQGYEQAFEMAYLYANARQYLARNDTATALRWSMVYIHHLHFSLRIQL